MSALINHVLVNNYKFLAPLNLKICNFAKRDVKTKPPKKNYKQRLDKVQVPKCRDLGSSQASLSARGFLRCQRDYQPPQNLEEQLQSLCAEITGGFDPKERIADSLKFDLFNECYKRFNHGIPNSLLHTINRYGDLLEFYMTPVDQVLPLEKLKRIPLPPNLHVQYEPVRFHPDDDTMFNGQTAFPKSNTIVTGLRSRKKFKGAKVTSEWDAFQ